DGPRPAAATAVGLASGALSGAAVRHFRRRGTTIEPFDPGRASVLVTTGVNSRTRNPMYVGLAGLLVAHALWRGSWVALVPVAGFVVVIDRVQVRAEESALLETFGSDYAEYRDAVPRWLGARRPSWRRAARA
ncbi:MAG: isoprenylcysteine carboxylmethyltransferase family protein, partial [Nocardioidaceae bacterium]